MTATIDKYDSEAASLLKDLSQSVECTREQLLNAADALECAPDNPTGEQRNLYTELAEHVIRCAPAHGMNVYVYGWDYEDDNWRDREKISYFYYGGNGDCHYLVLD